ncbi:hypothetical protein SK128_011581, partial [Halocaridina rubra]
CLVKKKIEETNIFYDTLEFSVANDGQINSSTDIVVSSYSDEELFCLQINSSHIVQKINQSIISAQKTTNTIKYWTTLRFGFCGNISLEDEHGRSWLAQRTYLQWPIKYIGITGGYLMKTCSQKTPTWEVNGTNEQHIPLFVNKKHLVLTLISPQTFNPIFNICGSQFKLGMSNGSLISGNSSGPLVAGRKQIFLEYVIPEEISLQVKDKDGNVIHEARCQEKPKIIFVKGNRKEKFFVVQHLKETGDEESTALHLISIYTITVLIGTLSVIILTITTQLFSLTVLRVSAFSPDISQII